MNTMPEATLKALADHGELGRVMAPDGGDCERVLAKFASAGIDVDVLAVATATRYRCAARRCCLSTPFLPQRSSPRRPPS